MEGNPQVGRRVIFCGPEGCNAKTQGKALTESVLEFAQLTDTDEEHVMKDKDETTPETGSPIELAEEINRTEIDKLFDRAESEVRFHRVMAEKNADELYARDRHIMNMKESQ